MGKIMLYVFLIFKLIIELSIISIIPITVVIITNKLLKNKIAFKFQYILYLLIILRLLVPMMPNTSLSIFNKVSIDKSKNSVVDAITNKKGETKFYSDKFQFSKLNKDMIIYTGKSQLLKINIKFLFILWLSGTIILSLYNGFIYVSFHKKVTRSRQLKNKNLDSIISEVKTSLNLKKNFKVLELSSIDSPAIFISKVPTLLLPKGLLENLSSEDLKNIIFHELCHYKRKDTLILYLSKLISIIYWFNPLILYSLKECKKALELSCDEMVLSYIGQEKKLDYGYTIINLLNHSKNYKNQTMALTMMGSKKQISHRIKLIRDFKKKGFLSKGVALASICFITLFIFTESSVDASEYINSEVSWRYIIDRDGSLRKVDDINIPFTPDDNVLGKWSSVDFVKNINDFNPNKRNWKDDLFLKNLEFLPNGQTPFPWSSWTKDIVIHYGDKTASKYYIQNIDGEEYMFFQWKSGDYSFRNRKPWYYVLKKQ